MIKYFRGKPVEECTRSELLDLIDHLGREVQRLKGLPVDWEVVAGVKGNAA